MVLKKLELSLEFKSNFKNVYRNEEILPLSFLTAELNEGD
jgi:hypothetical protein